MNDVSDQAWKLQVKYAMEMSPAQRATAGMEQINSIRDMIERQLLSTDPGMSKGDLACAVFERYYGHEFSSEMKIKIKRSILDWHSTHYTNQPA